MNRPACLLRLASLMLCAVFFMPSANAATWYVSTTGSDSNLGTTVAYPLATIQKAVSAAASGDTVFVSDGTYSGAGNVNMDFGAKDLVVKSVSNNPAACVIDCQQAGCAFILQKNQTANSLIQGFTITNGTGYPVGSVDIYGGGIFISYLNNNPVVNNCTFIGNSAQSGGGMQGGTATHCVFINNLATDSGGAMAYGMAIDCAFIGNTATGQYGSGGAMAYRCMALNCAFIGNSATSEGGGIDYALATNCVLTGNSATNGGGMANSTAINSVLTGNSATNGGGAYSSFSSNLTNCIVWNNFAPRNPNVSGGLVTYSDVQGGFSGAGNINADPKFVNLGSGNLHLSAGSPCIDTGSTTIPSGAAFPTTDKDGGKRVVGSKPDMGAYEYGNVGVFGKLAFDGIVSAAPAQNVTFQFRPVSGGAAINTTYFTTSDGAFYLYGVPDGSYNLWIKSPTYLSALVPVTVAGGVASITATLEPGDANNDNSVDSTDFGILIGAFNTSASVPGSGYDPTADFNGDGSVDSTDFGLLIGNFNTVGAQ